MNIKNKKELFIVAAIIIIIIIILILTIIFTIDEGEEVPLINSDLLYCNGNCYAYDGEYLAHYEMHEPDEDEELQQLKYICKIGDDCTEEILDEGDGYLIIKNDGLIEAYVTDGFRYEKHEDVSLKGKFYANDKAELYFISDTVVIIGLKDGSQKKENYFLENYVGNYAEFNLSSFSSLINYDDSRYRPTLYNLNNEEIFDYTKSDINSAKYIDTSFYDSNGEIKSDPKYIISGAYSSGYTEVVIRDNKAKIGSEDGVIESDFIVRDANKKYVQYRTDYIDFIYNFETKELCFSDIDEDSCYKPADASSFKYIKS